MRAAGAAAAALLLLAGGVAVWRVERSRGSAPAAPYMPKSLAAGKAHASAALARLTSGSSRTRRFEYVVSGPGFSVYDIARGQRLVQRVEIPQLAGVRGVIASPRTHMLYLSYGGDGGGNGNGSLLAYDLVRDRIVWRKRYPTGIDSGDITPDGRRIYMPTGEASPGGDWNVLDARSGEVVAVVHGEPGPHNTIVGRDGSRVFLGPRNGNHLAVASTKTNRVVKRIGPLYSGVRPFTLNGSETVAYTSATGLFGFQVSSVVTGKVLSTVHFAGFRWDQERYPFTDPSHGISLSPDSRELYVLDAPNAYVHVYDVSGEPRRPPRHLADIRLAHDFTGQEIPCDYDCDRDGWLQTSRDGRYLYVGDNGDVVDTRSRRVVAFIPALRQTRKMIEIDWRGGVPVSTTSRIGRGYPAG
jgi:DNA-binding beta-propeller fold protein YncE